MKESYLDKLKESAKLTKKALTLYVNKELIKRAKIYAVQHDMKLSELFEKAVEKFIEEG